MPQFLSQLPVLWKQGDARPTHSRKKVKVRYWRTREDPFKEEWPEVLLWLQNEPDNTAKNLFIRLQEKYPGKFADGQLRTLQRHIKEWRQIMARYLVYACLDLKNGNGNIVPVGSKN